jgi:hypothetical protein
MAIVDALLKVDKDILNPGVVKSIRIILPQELETKALANYDGELENLATADRFWYAVQEINGYSERVDSLAFLYEYPELSDDLS